MFMRLTSLLRCDDPSGQPSEVARRKTDQQVEHISFQVSRLPGHIDIPFPADRLLEPGRFGFINLPLSFSLAGKLRRKRNKGGSNLNEEWLVLRLVAIIINMKSGDSILALQFILGLNEPRRCCGSVVT